jgi:hypothetical protein
MYKVFVAHFTTYNFVSVYIRAHVLNEKNLGDFSPLANEFFFYLTLTDSYSTIKIKYCHSNNILCRTAVSHSSKQQ